MFDPLTRSQTELTLACQQTDDTLIGHIGCIEVKSGVVLVGISLWKGWMNSTGHVRQYSKLICTTIHREEEEKNLPDDNAVFMWLIKIARGSYLDSSHFADATDISVARM